MVEKKNLDLSATGLTLQGIIGAVSRTKKGSILITVLTSDHLFRVIFSGKDLPSPGDSYDRKVRPAGQGTDIFFEVN